MVFLSEKAGTTMDILNNPIFQHLLTIGVIIIGLLGFSIVVTMLIGLLIGIIKIIKELL